LIDVATPPVRNVIQKETENKFEYKYLNTEMQRMLNMECFVMPVIIVARRIVTKNNYTRE